MSHDKRLYLRKRPHRPQQLHTDSAKTETWKIPHMKSKQSGFQMKGNMYMACLPFLRKFSLHGESNSSSLNVSEIVQWLPFETIHFYCTQWLYQLMFVRFVICTSSIFR